MAYPTVIYGPDGEQFNTYAATGINAQRWPFGTQMTLQDGRKYRFCSAGGSTLTIGDIEQSSANVTNDQGRTGIAAAVGARAPTLTLGGATTQNLYAEGYFMISVTPGAGQTYVIDNHLAGTTAVAFNLASGHAIRVALTTTSRVDLVANPYKAVIQLPATTATGTVVGVAVSAPTTTQFAWVQTAGMASVLTEATTVPVAGRAFSATLVTAGAGGQGLHNATTADFAQVGITFRAAAVNAWSDVRLTIDS